MRAGRGRGVELPELLRRAVAPALGRAMAVIGIGVATLGCGSDPPREAARAAASPEAERPAPTPAGAAAHLRTLQQIARTHGGTRAAGTPGDRATSDHLVERLRGAGYTVTRQQVRFPHFETTGRPRVSQGGAPLPGGRGSVAALQYTPGGSVRGSLRRIGLGCTRSQAAPLRSGDVALARRGRCTFRRKALIAGRSGAVALLVAGRPREPVIRASLGRPGVTIPTLFIAHRAAAALRAGARVDVRVRAVSELRVSDNVLAAAPGPARHSVMAGAHLDSVPGSPGLNDNGSGVAAVLDVAERLAADGKPPERIRFAFWTAEELGLIGSRAFVRRLEPTERRAIAAYLNLDMVGSPHPRPIVYAARTDPTEQRLERLLLAGLRREGITARSRAVPSRSDHSPFARAGIPVGGLFTGAGRPADPCYHRACDDLSNVDAKLTQAMADAARRALVRLADGS